MIKKSEEDRSEAVGKLLKVLAEVLGNEEFLGLIDNATASLSPALIQVYLFGFAQGVSASNRDKDEIVKKAFTEFSATLGITIYASASEMKPK